MTETRTYGMHTEETSTTESTTNSQNDFLVTTADGLIMRYSEYLDYVRNN